MPIAAERHSRRDDHAYDAPFATRRAPRARRSRASAPSRCRRARRRCRSPRVPARRARTPRTESARNGDRPPIARRARASSRCARSADPCSPTRSRSRIAGVERRRVSARAHDERHRVVHPMPLRRRHVERIGRARSASDDCFTSPTTPTTAYQSPSSGPKRSRWPSGSSPAKLARRERFVDEHGAWRVPGRRAHRAGGRAAAECPSRRSSRASPRSAARRRHRFGVGIASKCTPYISISPLSGSRLVNDAAVTPGTLRTAVERLGVERYVRCRRAGRCAVGWNCGPVSCTCMRQQVRRSKPTGTAKTRWMLLTAAPRSPAAPAPARPRRPRAVRARAGAAGVFERELSLQPWCRSRGSAERRQHSDDDADQRRDDESEGEHRRRPGGSRQRAAARRD